jgi:hypothetical protein
MNKHMASDVFLAMQREPIHTGSQPARDAKGKAVIGGNRRIASRSLISAVREQTANNGAAYDSAEEREMLDNLFWTCLEYLWSAIDREIRPRPRRDQMYTDLLRYSINATERELAVAVSKAHALAYTVETMGQNPRPL